MKLTSGVRLNERRKRALSRLETCTYEAALQGRRGVKPLRTVEQWTARRDEEIARLKRLTGQLFS